MKLIEARRAIRHLLRDDTYPQEDVDLAIQTVLNDVNVMHRFRFHEATYTFNLTANNYAYPVPSNVMAERVLVYALGNNTYEQEIPRKREPWVDYPIRPSENGNTPGNWHRYDNNWIIDPIPNNTMVTNGNVTVFYDKDLTMPTSPLDAFGIPDRHRNVIIYGATALLRPNIIVASPEGDARVETLYQRAVRYMVEQELWDYGKIPALRKDERWRNCNNWGYVSRIRS